MIKLRVYPTEAIFGKLSRAGKLFSFRKCLQGTLSRWKLHTFPHRGQKECNAASRRQCAINEMRAGSIYMKLRLEMSEVLSLKNRRIVVAWCDPFTHILRAYKEERKKVLLANIYIYMWALLHWQSTRGPLCCQRNDCQHIIEYSPFEPIFRQKTLVW